MEDNAELAAARRVKAQLEKGQREMDERGIVLSPEAQRGYEAVMEAARQSIAALEELNGKED